MTKPKTNKIKTTCLYFNHVNSNAIDKSVCQISNKYEIFM